MRRQSPRSLWSLSFPFVFCVSFWPTVSAQTFTGSISGRVLDATGLQVQNVEVVATEVATSETSRTLTNAAGDYSLNFLKPGTYRVASAVAQEQIVVST